MAGRGRRKTRRKSKPSKKKSLVSGTNVALVLLSITSVAFVASVVNRHLRGGMTIQDFRQEAPLALTVAAHDNSLLRDIEVEVLNGCGINGLAQQFTDYLRDKHLDVIRTEDADNFHYDKTIVILRRDEFKKVAQVAKLLDISPRDSIRVFVDPDGSLLTDVTIVIGSDYLNISPVQRFLASQH
ncbi:MAG TPA: LytR family transcriptional regulator, partial [Candidatus Marinimicrobia bacterium]|nr:LytR family transcriptional regulator [Candidatus Neomarinimicrobiota bacterium]